MALLRSAATVGFYTLLSRVLGFVRDMLTAAYLGAGPVNDAFVVALRLPNLFRTLFAEGAFSAAFVPVFAGMIHTDGPAAARRFAEETLAVLVAALLLFLIAAEILAPELVALIAPGFRSDPEKFRLTVAMTRITFPYLVYISLVALQGGVLNSLERFAATAAAPMLLNICLIAALVSARPLTGRALAWAVTVAGFAQFLWLMASCARAGMPLALPLPRITAAVGKLMRLMLPGTFGAGVTQLNLFLSTAVASLLPAGAVSYLYYADRLNQLPLGVVGIAVGTAVLPSLSRQVRTADEAGAIATQNRGIELALLLTLPAAMALAVLAQPILASLFERGAFGPRETAATAPALAAYAAGLPAFVLVKLLAAGFFARQDTRTPVLLAVLSLVVNAAAMGILGFALGFAHVGVAMATSIAGWVNALGLWTILGRRAHFTFDARSRRVLPRLLAATLGMGALLWVLVELLSGPLAGDIAHRLVALALLVAAGLASFAALAFILGAADWREVSGRFRRQSA